MSKQDLKARLATLSQGIAGRMQEIASHRQTIADVTSEHEGAIERLFVLVAKDLYVGSELLVADGQDWRPWARTTGAASSDPTLYRLRNAGAVAGIIDEAEGVDIGDAFYTALVPLYRYVNPSSVKTEKDQEKGRKALVSLWTRLSAKGTPDPKAVQAAVDKARPATKGKPKADKAEGESSGRNDPTATTENGNDPETVEMPDVANLEGAATNLASQLAGFKRKGISEAHARAIMAATVRMCREYGPESVALALGGVK
jgi:hypothetical protein